MSKMNINDAAIFFGVSKEAIHNRIRRGSLESVIENGVKLVLVDETRAKKVSPRVSIAKATLSEERYYKLLEEQNAKLQSRVEVLEGETRSLRDQKEQMLIEERIKIENIYKEKDEQLKNILSTISSQFIRNTPLQELKEVESLEAEIEEEPEVKTLERQKPSKVISLKKYLKKLKLSDKKIEKVHKRFKKLQDKDERILVKKNKLYVDVKKYKYEDLV